MQMTLDRLEERRLEAGPARAHAASEDHRVGIVESRHIDGREADPPADLGPGLRVGEVLGSDAVAPLDRAPARERLEAPRAAAVTGRAAEPCGPQHHVAALGVVPSEGDAPVAHDAGADARGDGAVHDRRAPGAGADAGLGESRAVGVILDNNGTLEPLRQQVGQLQPVPGRRHPGRVEQRAALAVERPGGRDCDRLGKQALHHGLDETAEGGERSGRRGRDPPYRADGAAAPGGGSDLGAADVEQRDHPVMMPTLAAMLLAIDVGNTNIVVGVFDGERLTADFRIHTDDRFTGDELGLALVDLLEHRDLTPDRITAVVVCSVVPTLARSIDELSHTYFKQAPMVVGPGTRTGIRIQYDDPRRVGADRIANAIAAHHLYQGPAVLVDFGTATTFDAIDARGDYMGGAIAPGIQVSLDALVNHAAMLSRIELTAPLEAIGRSTTTSMQSGMVYGYVGLVEGLVERFRKEIPGQAKVIATGGLAASLAPLMPSIDIVDERLTLHGLRLIYDQNR